MCNKTNIYFLFTIILFFLFNCSKNPIGNSDKKIIVTIVNQTGEPIEGAFIEGGLDWTRFKVKTNEYGQATVPYGEKGTIYRTNYFPIIVNNLYSIKYQLKGTPKKVKLIDSIKGKEAIVFNSYFIVTIGYDGLYFVYSYNDESVNEIGQHQIAKTYKQLKLIGDTLWLTTHEDGLYCYSISDINNPLEIGHWDFSGYLNAFAIKDSILALAEAWNAGPLKLFHLISNKSYVKLSEIKNYFIKELYFKNSYIIALGNNDCLPSVFDVSNFNEIKIAYNGIEWEYESGLFYDDHVFLKPRYGIASEYNNYKVLDVSDPSNPIYSSDLKTDSKLIHIQTDSKAIGTYYFNSKSVTLLEGNITGNFYTKAIIAEDAIESYQGCFNTYFIVGNKLWRLLD